MTKTSINKIKTNLEQFSKQFINQFSIILKNTKFSNICEIGSKNVTWERIDFCVGSKMLEEEFKELKTAIKDRDPKEILDGSYDIAVIALNIPYKYFRMKGLNHDEALLRTEEGFHKVLDSNLSKIKPDGTVDTDKDGKVQKPSTYFKPDFTELLKDLD